MNLLIKIKLLERGMSQFRLSREVGVSDGYLSKLIQGWIDPTQEIKERIAKALDCRVEDIFSDRAEGNL